jgi:hypothetical protein
MSFVPTTTPSSEDSPSPTTTTTPSERPSLELTTFTPSPPLLFSTSPVFYSPSVCPPLDITSDDYLEPQQQLAEAVAARKAKEPEQAQLTRKRREERISAGAEEAFSLAHPPVKKSRSFYAARPPSFSRSPVDRVPPVPLPVTFEYTFSNQNRFFACMDMGTIPGNR